MKETPPDFKVGQVVFYKTSLCYYFRIRRRRFEKAFGWWQYQDAVSKAWYSKPSLRVQTDKEKG